MNDIFRDHFESAFASLLERPGMHFSARWEEGCLCATLQLWEAIATSDPQAEQWHHFWLECRRKVRTAETPDDVAPSTIDRARQRVQRGMSRVLQRLKREYRPAVGTNSSWGERARITEAVVRLQLSPRASFRDPESLEGALLTLLQWLEWFLTHGASRQKAKAIWRDEIRKTRGFGPPSTKTFATATPLKKRLESAPGLLQLRLSFEPLVGAMRKAVACLAKYLARREAKAALVV